MTDKAEKGALIVVSAPSGCGKSTILKRLMDRRENLRFSVSATTRAPRPGERDGVDYFFVSRAEFRQMILNDAFLEYAQYVDNFYGTPRAAVEAQLSQACDVYLDIEVQGAMQVKRNRPETLLIFVMPPSMEELERRLTGRGAVDPEIGRRTRSVILMDSGHVVLSALQPETIAGRVSGKSAPVPAGGEDPDD